MLFNSLTFIVFFIVVLSLYNLLSNWTLKKTLLLIASYIFYGSWNPPFLLLLFLSTLIDWFSAKGIELSRSSFSKRLFLILSLISNLGMLSFFKYGNFFLENVQKFSGLFSDTSTYDKLDIILPVGISFYTFQTLSYTIDIYKGNLRSSKSLLDFSLYVTFFPQLVAGPIVRAIDFLPQCATQKKATSGQLGWGLYFMTLGLFQKVVLADVFLAPTANNIFNYSKGPLHTFDTWIGLLAFTGQIFFDFAGYSTCAIGAALCFGILLPDNFRFPFAAIGFSDLWKRWHISLSTWLKDYLYIPLGGNRGPTIRKMINLFLTMFLGGLWHGAAWTFIIWGTLHGLILVIEQLLIKIVKIDLTTHILGRSFLRIVTFIFFMLPLVYFRSQDIAHGSEIMASLWGPGSEGVKILTSVEILKVIVIVFSLIAAHWYMHETKIETVMEKMPSWFIVSVWSLMIFALVISQGGNNAFIYFQF